jgi:hypothetical protein
MDFFKMAKTLKLYPTVVPLDTLKKVVMKSPEYWQQIASGVSEEGKDFNFTDFCKAIRVSSILIF